jgi:PAN domain
MAIYFVRPITLCCAVGAAAMSVGTAWADTKPTIQKTTGMWVEGPGFDIKYGGNFDQCAVRCLATASCAMIEYYRPEKKCNMYDTVRALKIGGSSIIGTKKTGKP